MPTHEYHIEKFVHGGFGLSHTQDGQVILLEGAIPKEVVTAEILSSGKNLLQGFTSRILLPSEFRIPAPCPYYHKCGGCDFQHLEYTRQLQGKHDILQDLLRRSRHPALNLAATGILTQPIASPQQTGYRQRIRLQVDSQHRVGFYKRRSHNCVSIKNCLLAAPEINTCLKDLLQQHFFDKLLFQTDTLEILLNPSNNRIHIVLHFKRKPRPTDILNAGNLTQALPSLEKIIFTGKTFAASVHGSLSFTLSPIPSYTEKELSLSWETGAFCQVNIEQNLILIKTVLDFCRIKKEEAVLDLFCGMGNFSVPLAEKAGRVLGIEGQASAIRSAKQNSSLASQNNTDFFKSPIHQACKELVQENKVFDCIVVDPPRQGIPGLAREMSRLCRKRLIYISCDPATLCRDLVDLLHQGFTLHKLQPLDMFPQTHHIETVALLKKNTPS